MTYLSANKTSRGGWKQQAWGTLSVSWIVYGFLLLKPCLKLRLLKNFQCEEQSGGLVCREIANVAFSSTCCTAALW